METQHEQIAKIKKGLGYKAYKVSAQTQDEERKTFLAMKTRPSHNGCVMTIDEAKKRERQTLRPR
jgi:hypothetical protein